MEEQNKNPEKKENEVQTSQENTPQNATPTRSYVLMILAGCYLLYTGYRLCKNVIDGVDGGSWGFFAAGIGFLIVGAVMLFIGGKNFIKRDKEKRAMEEAARAEEKVLRNVRDWLQVLKSQRAKTKQRSRTSQKRLI